MSCPAGVRLSFAITSGNGESAVALAEAAAHSASKRIPRRYGNFKTPLRNKTFRCGDANSHSRVFLRDFAVKEVEGCGIDLDHGDAGIEKLTESGVGSDTGIVWDSLQKSGRNNGIPAFPTGWCAGVLDR